MALKKAVIHVHTQPPKKIEVLFNPSEYNLQRSNNYALIKPTGVDSPILQFINGEEETLNLELFFDTYTEFKFDKFKKDVRKEYTNKVFDLMKVNKKLHAPPICTFQWGSLKFKGVVKEVKQTILMFTDEGKPVRAKLDVTFLKYEKLGQQQRNTPRESPDRTKSRVLNQGQHLWMLANEEYDDPRMWRKIAKENNLLNPRKIKTGQVVKVPAID
ncbi:CIS tube protein [Crassaminicella profunda]|uniref:CIS tube protein n=1 Tax=Crassaminicella profunda TaxID=1286698 RepID=UPI001CA6296C|nr:hypothetical protein [Crassaminicella profunda]QZY54474.1 hypothetical protein K7H06_15730 [Crassaminicella profunda]